jgi:hypothetical protein
LGIVAVGVTTVTTKATRILHIAIQPVKLFLQPLIPQPLTPITIESPPFSRYAIQAAETHAFAEELTQQAVIISSVAAEDKAHLHSPKI